MPGNRYRVHHVPGMGFNSAPCGGDMVDLELLIRRKSTLLTLVDLPLASRRLQRRTNWEMRRLPWKPRSRGCRTSCKRGCSPAPPPSWPWRSPPPPPRRSSSSSPRRRRRPPTWAGRRPDTPRRRTPGQCRFSRNSNGEPPQIAAAAGRRGTQRRHLGKISAERSSLVNDAYTDVWRNSGDAHWPRLPIQETRKKSNCVVPAWRFRQLPLLPRAPSTFCRLCCVYFSWFICFRPLLFWKYRSIPAKPAKTPIYSA